MLSNLLQNYIEILGLYCFSFEYYQSEFSKILPPFIAPLLLSLREYTCKVHFYTYRFTFLNLDFSSMLDLENRYFAKIQYQTKLDFILSGNMITSNITEQLLTKVSFSYLESVPR